MPLARLPRALVAVGIFALLCFGFFVSTIRNAQEDISDNPIITEDTRIEGTLAPNAQTLSSLTAHTALTPSVTTLATPTIPSYGAATTTGQPNGHTQTADVHETSPSDVVLILKTGSSSVWRRLPLHLLTTLADSRVPNYAIYSDAAERLAPGVVTIDAIANVTDFLQEHDPEVYRIYQTQQESIRPYLYREQAGLPGDTVPASTDNGNAEGWVLDKYKFLPMLAHAWRSWPDAKWFVYIEDDTFIFWQNLLEWLARQSHDEVTYFGAFSGSSPNTTFAQGGSGIVFSQALMRKVFAGDRPADLNVYMSLASKSCCGDMILGDVMRDYGAKVNRGEFGSLSFRPEPPWKTRFDASVWCDQILTFHHLHQQDLAALAELENELLKEKDRRILFRDVYMEFIDPYINTAELPDWDNFADLYTLGSNATVPPALWESGVELRPPVNTSKACHEACSDVSACFSWHFDGNSCSIDTGVKLGQAIAAKGNLSTTVSGWMLSRLNETLLANECQDFRSWT